MRRIKLTLEYDGTDFSGWQVQPDQRTVQGALQESLSNMMGSQIKVIGSGRTDAGVHAVEQVAHADVTRDIPATNIMMGLNSSLDRDVRVLECVDTEPAFHAQRSATGKTYRYIILNGPRPTALDRYRVWYIRQPLDLEAMAQGAAHLIGEQDFAAFKSAGDETTTVRTLRKVDIKKTGDHIVLLFEANGFLKHMVRNLTGALVEVGQGKLFPDDIRRLLLGRSRENAPKKAPPQGLTLMQVTY
ncbi:MAG: tRNA pseudouridine(38-40) synthase TruA [bacterium]|nr:tRNA pseudouridine(38-40) synthase TruA [bacterium]MDT8366171.1 tRNA pseudouridine(38-40) synthase TruA [bacterium]